MTGLLVSQAQTTTQSPVSQEKTIYDFVVKDMDGKDVNLSDYKGYVVLIVNTASKCGFTPQYEGLQKLYTTYKDKKFVILGFPCNQFANQEPGNNEEIKSFCSLNYGVTFPMFDKIDVNGENEAPLYTFLKAGKDGEDGGKIKWNFTKFLIGKDGKIVQRYAPSTKPEKLDADILKLL